MLWPASTALAEDSASASGDSPTASALEEQSPSDNDAAPKDDTSSDSKAETATQAALQKAIAPRRAQSRAIATLLDDDDTWTSYHQWLHAIGEHATKGQAAWSTHLCEASLAGAQTHQKALGVNRLDRASAHIEAEVLLDAAAHCAQAAFIDLAMRAVSNALPQMRDGVVTRGMRDALVQLAAVENVERLQKTDTRLLIPYVNALLHLQDHAAVERLTTLKIAANPSSGKAQLEQMHARATRAAPYTLPVNAPEGCEPMLDGERVRGQTVEVRQGTHNVGCQNGDIRLRYYTKESTALF